MLPGQLDVGAQDFWTGFESAGSARVLEGICECLLVLAASKGSIVTLGVVFRKAPCRDLRGPCSADLGALIRP